ncbi:MAG: hypothetical protein NVSMB46_04310 [Candidatus Saccharimonadales bacterium]
MNFVNKFITKASIVGTLLSVAMLVGLGISTKASAACYQYSANGENTSATPVFNNFCDAPYGVGNEADFVRVRKSTNGNDIDNQNNPLYTNTLDGVCAANDKFDVWTYVHNNASPNYNNNGTGSAVAHDVQLALHAPLGSAQPNNSFVFSGKVTASNAASVQDTATINCGTHNVTLSLVPSTVHIYSKQYAGWKDLNDSSVNSSIKLGSPNLGSGDQWGCFDYRIVVVYQVTVKEVPPVVKTNAVCTLLTLESQDQVARIDSVSYSANDAKVSGISIDYGNGYTTTYQPADFPVKYSYTTPGSYIVRATLLTDMGNVTSDTCVKTVNYATIGQPKPPVTPTPAPTPQVLPNTGAGDMVGIFSATTLAGSAAHHLVTARRRRKA